MSGQNRYHSILNSCNQKKKVKHVLSEYCDEIASYILKDLAESSVFEISRDGRPVEKKMNMTI